MVQPLGQSLELGQSESGDARGNLKWRQCRGGRTKHRSVQAEKRSPSSSTFGASASASSLATVTESVNAQLRRLLRGGKADPAVIAQLFAVEVAPLPGVTLPAGRVEDKFEGTDAALRLQSVFLELTPEQRKVAAPYLGLAPFPDAKRQLPPFNMKPFVPPAAMRALRTSPAFRPQLLEAGFVLLPNPPQTTEETTSASPRATSGRLPRPHRGRR